MKEKSDLDRLMEGEEVSDEVVKGFYRTIHSKTGINYSGGLILTNNQNYDEDMVTKRILDRVYKTISIDRLNK